MTTKKKETATKKKTTAKKKVTKPVEKSVEVPKQVLKVQLLSEHAKAPELATDGSAGYDLYATSASSDGITWVYGTGLAFEIPEGYVGLLLPRSSVYKMDMVLANSVGVIDSDYRGEVKAVYRVNGGKRYVPGQKVAQLVIVPALSLPVAVVKNLSKTKRGEGAFGSTGV
jgi:dUTP pyrophosphatase